MIKYRHTFGAKQAIALLVLVVVSGLSWATLNAEEAPTLIVTVLWGIVGVLVLVFLGALVSTSVEVNEAGVFSMSKTLGGLPFTKIRLESGAIKAVELHRTMTPGIDSGSDPGSSRPDRPRYRLHVIHEHGTCFVEASTDHASISSSAERLAETLNRPLQKTGDWIS